MLRFLVDIKRKFVRNIQFLSLLRFPLKLIANGVIGLMAHAQRHVVEALGSTNELKKFLQPLRVNHAKDLPLLRKPAILNHAEVIQIMN